MTFKDKLKADLKAERYVLTDLADRSNISNSYLFRILAGQLLPSIGTAEELAKQATYMTRVAYTPDMFLTVANELHND